MLDMERFNQALQVSLQAHRQQKRKGSAVPYITHPVRVAETLAYHYPGDPDLALAGLLHDVLEDTDWPAAALESEFGPEVLALVQGVTKPPHTSGDQAKEAMLLKLPHASLRVLRLKAADALANLESLERDLWAGNPIWSRFRSGKDAQLRYYLGIVQAVQDRLQPEPLAQQLRLQFDRVFGQHAT